MNHKFCNMFTQRYNLCIFFTLLITISSSQQQQRRPPQRPSRLPPRLQSNGPNRQGLPPQPSRGSSNRLPPFQPQNVGSGILNRPRPSKFNRPINSNRPPPLPELNRPSRQSQQPSLLRGFDLVDFKLPEDTPVGKEVYTLKAKNPSSGKILYTISGDHFSVDINTGKYYSSIKSDPTNSS